MKSLHNIHTIRSTCRLIDAARWFLVLLLAIAMPGQESAPGVPPKGASPDDAKSLLSLASATLAYVERTAPQPALRRELDELLRRPAPDPSEIRALRRRILFAHPSLQFDDLLFNKQMCITSGHMVDHYTGRQMRPAEGLTVLEHWKDAPRERQLHRDSLPPGTAFHPDLSFDGKRVLFSYCIDKPDDLRETKQFFIYEIGIDGSGLRQITGTDRDPMVGKEVRKTSVIEDWDPCYLPDGGIIFVSSRLQGHVRCTYAARYNPTFCLYRMNADGSGIRQLSFGDIAEYDPAVLPDGRIIYCRWEYTDRHDSMFHGLWTINPDGTGTAHYYGNYTRSPNVIVEALPLPESNRVIAQAAPHHFNFKGSIISIDPAKGEDGLEPITRLTPEVGFPETPEAPANSGRYAGAYPVTDDLFFVSYLEKETGEMAIYLLDTFGGREFIHRAPKTSCYSPIPLRARPVPPVRASALPKQAQVSTTGTFSISDVYQSRQPIPPGSAQFLRVIELLDQVAEIYPRVGAGNASQPRKILGEVPVAEDGSVAFEAPAGKPLQFQLLDANRMAVMNMRTFVYLQPGEVSSCIGCHEPKTDAPPTKRRRVAAQVQKLTPLQFSSHPGGFSFGRSVQPVLDQRCISCHGLERTDGKVNLLGSRLDLASGIDYGKIPRFLECSLAYGSLVPFAKILDKNLQTDFSIPMDYTSHASALKPLLLSSHHGVLLKPEERHAITAWLDLNVPMYGDWSWNKPEFRTIRPGAEAALRRFIAGRFGEGLSAQPLDALVNRSDVSLSRILLAPLAVEAGGWGQIPGGWSSQNDPNLAEARRLVDELFLPLPYQDLAGTCGRGSDKGCICHSCWAREFRDGDVSAPKRSRIYPAFAPAPYPWKPILSSLGGSLVDRTGRSDGAHGPALAMDGDASTAWISKVESNDKGPLPHELIMDLGGTRRLTGFHYLPIQTPWGAVGMTEVQIQVGLDGKTWGEPVTITKVDNISLLSIRLPAVQEGRYVRLLTKTWGKNPLGIAELDPILDDGTGVSWWDSVPAWSMAMQRKGMWPWP